MGFTIWNNHNFCYDMSSLQLIHFSVLMHLKFNYLTEIFWLQFKGNKCYSWIKIFSNNEKEGLDITKKMGLKQMS